MAVGSVAAGKAYIIISALDKTQAGIAQARANLDGFIKKYDAMSQNMLSKGATMAGYAAGAMAAPAFSLNEFADFDRAMVTVQAKLHATGEEYQYLSDLARKYGRDTSWTAKQVAENMVTLASQGLNRSQIETMLPATLSLARAVSADDLSSVTHTLLTTLHSLQQPLTEAARFADVFTVAVNGSAMNMENFAESLKMAAPFADGADVEIEQLSAGLMAMANAGIEGSLAGTAMKNFLSRLAKKDDFFKGYGINVFDEEGSFKSFDQIFSDIQARLQTLSQKERMNFIIQAFGMYGAAGINNMFNSKDMGKFLNQLRNAKGEADATAKHMESGIWGSLQRIYSAIADVVLTFGKAFAGPVMVLEGAIIWVANTLSKWIDLSQGWIRLLYMAIGIIGGVGGTLVAVGLAIKLWSLGLTLATVACSAFLKILLFLPKVLTLIQGLFFALFTPLGAIALLAGVLLYKFTNFFGILGSSIQGFVDLLSQGKVEAAWELICLGMKDLWLDFSHSVVGMWLWVIKKVMGMISNIGPLWKRMMGDITFEDWSKALDEDYNRAGVENQKRIETLKKKVSEANVWTPADLNPLSEEGTLPEAQLGEMVKGLPGLKAGGSIGQAIASAISAGTSEFYQKFSENKANASGERTLETIADNTGELTSQFNKLLERVDDLEDTVGI